MHVKGVGEVGALDLGLICMLKSMSLLVEKLIKSEGDAFKICVVDEFGNACLEINAPGKILLKLLKAKIPTDSQFNSLYKFEPYIEMALEQILEFGLYRLHLPQRLEVPVSNARELMSHLNKCVDKIRQESKSKQFQSKLNSYRRSSNKNHKELTKYIDALFERYSKLLVLRIDLSYSKENSKTTQAEAARDREHLFENARSNKLFADMVGWIWKLEHGPEKGFHYHMMFFLMVLRFERI
ncbi:inovirus-type Gp2 protein [Pseudomonas sp. WAC2]|uniref:YagK/YfjJ domain-containing protein n=1 Tax=Pseudomonas sp. WAC2 TaxID=3055057 RepID=UPI0025AFD0EB|nr:inovirus-type Gp2 protein [Pseudomonas sp. WAC2]MDN3234319.1 inovirus-type Gp2 protein [Pseudomonas sp. WAC2]